MVKRIVILNSGVYGKASVRLDDCNSIQLVGPNNIGKSTLIYTLNYLFIIDGRKMSFSGNRSEKDTLHYYFPNQTNSFLIFEIYKHRYYCILIKRGEDGLEYYKIDSDYKEELFLETQDKQQKVLKFEEVRRNIITKGIDLYQFRDKKEVFNFIYQRGKRSNAAIWLEDSVVSDGLSNNFSKVYRYLIDSKLITNKTLKDTLIIADNRDKEGINFSQKDRKDIVNLLKANDEIKVFESIKSDFHQFREIVSLHKAKEKTVRELIYAFNKQYTFSKTEFETRVKEKSEEIEKITFNINEELQPKQKDLLIEVGVLKNEISTKSDLVENLQKQLNEINSFENKEFIQQAIYNLDEKRRDIETRLTLIDTRGLSAKQIETKISTLKNQIESKTREITNFSKRLIQNISSSQEVKEQINFILSEEFLSNLTNDDVEIQVSKIDKLMRLFDGEIKITSKLKAKPIASLDEINEEVQQMKVELSDYEKNLPVVKDIESKKLELIQLLKTIEDYKTKVKKIDSKEDIEKQINITKSEIKTKSIDKEAKEKENEQLKEEIARKSESFKSLLEEKGFFQRRLEEIRKQKLEIEGFGLDSIEYETSDGLENIYTKIRLFNSERLELKSNKERAFDRLKDKVRSTIASEDEFIKYVEEEIACLPDKRNSIDGYLQAISVQFANPSASLIRRYNEFKEFIYNKFNSKLGRTRFSDIESLKIELVETKTIIDELKKISSIQDLKSQLEFDFGQSDNLTILNKYLDNGKEIRFEDLFEIELHLTKGGKERKVDLKDQVESDGTDKMIRLVIIMSVINRLAINDKENKIVVFIDEIATIDGQNRRELFKFCNEHNFIPICASPDETILDGFDKYILLFRPQKGTKVNLNEKQPNVMFQQKLVHHETN
ncbi:MAG TPA: hypothetical protein PK784_05570 [Tenuifilaceae bacterium]|nr:hypothetical protein [Tenuifilaceae bacterium]HPN22070.1 hypothetical protein [Tenuifilaceae bacterium]